MPLFNAILDPTSPRYKDWREIFDGEEVPLESPEVYEAKFGTQPGTTRIYKLGISRLTLEQRERLLKWIVEKFSADREAASKQIDAEGFPIREVDVVVSFDMRAFI